MVYLYGETTVDMIYRVFRGPGGQFTRVESSPRLPAAQEQLRQRRRRSFLAGAFVNTVTGGGHFLRVKYSVAMGLNIRVEKWLRAVKTNVRLS